MDVVVGSIVIFLAVVGLIGLMFLGSLHILRCTESRQELFSWASIGRSISLLWEFLMGR